MFRAARLVMGHYRYGLHRIGPSRDGFTYVTVLRDPVARVLSQWNWCTPRAMPASCMPGYSVLSQWNCVCMCIYTCMYAYPQA